MKHKYKFVCYALVGFFLVSFLKANAQCTATLAHTGHGCMGDTLKVTTTGANSVQWLKDGNVIGVEFNANKGTYGKQVAGGPTRGYYNYGNSADRINSPWQVYVDSSGNLFIADAGNNRIQKWAPGATRGVTVAGDSTGIYGSDSTLLNYPDGVFVDKKGNIYVSDGNNNRVQKWAHGAKYGVTVAGSVLCDSGRDAAHLSGPGSIYVDSKGNIYIPDYTNNRVQKWAPGAKRGITVAGDSSGLAGSDSAHLNQPNAVWLDTAGNIYVADAQNNRIQKWAPGAKGGITVAGITGLYNGNPNTLQRPYNVVLDSQNNIYVSDISSQVLKFAPGTNYGVTIAGEEHGYLGTLSSLLYWPVGICLHGNNRLFVADQYTSRVSEWTSMPKANTFTYMHVVDNPGKYAVRVIYNNGCTVTSSSNDFYYVSHSSFFTTVCAGQSYKFHGATYSAPGTYTVRLSSSSGCDSVINLFVHQGSKKRVDIDTALPSGHTYLFNSRSLKATGLYFDTVHIKTGCDSVTALHLVFYPAKTTLSQTGHGCSGDTIHVNLMGAEQIEWRRNGQTVARVKPTPYAITVAGQKNGQYGHDSSHLFSPMAIYIDDSSNVYVADAGNNRIQKWLPGAKHGVTVAGRTDTIGHRDSAHFNYPRNIYLDSAGNMYITDQRNNRIQKWARGARYGTTVAGSRDTTSGSDTYHLDHPTCAITDKKGNLFISDNNNYRIIKWKQGDYYGTPEAGNITTNLNTIFTWDSASLWSMYDICLDNSNNIYIAGTSGEGEVQKWVQGATYGQTIAGYRYDNVYSFSFGPYKDDSIGLGYPEGLYLDGANNFYVTDVRTGLVKKWTQGNSYANIVAGAYDGNNNIDSIHLSSPTSVKFDKQGYMYVCDAGHNRVQRYGGPYTLNGMYSFVPGTPGHYSAVITYHNGGRVYTDTIYDSLSNAYTTIDAGFCPGQSYTFNKTTYSTAGTYIAKYPAKSGCDSSVTLNLAAYPNSYVSINTCVFTGSSYTLHGKHFSAGGIYYDSIKTRQGCDSIITLNLTATKGMVSYYGKPCIGDTFTLITAGAQKVLWSWQNRLINIFYGKPGATYGVTVAGQKDSMPGTDSMHLYGPHGLFLDSAGNLYISESGNNRVTRWSPGAKYGVTVAGQKDGTIGSDSAHLYANTGVWVDKRGNVFVADVGNNRVQKWAPGAKYGTTVAGDKYGYHGSDSAHLYWPFNICVDSADNVYVADYYNCRVQRWAPGAKYGITVAGQKSGKFGTDDTHLYLPTGVYVDKLQNVYVADYYNNRVQMWAKGSSYGITVAGLFDGTGGTDSLHLLLPYSVYMDNLNNLYVSDFGNYRVQRFTPHKDYGVTVAGSKQCIGGKDSLHLNTAGSVAVDTAGNVYVCDVFNHRVQKWRLNLPIDSLSIRPDSVGLYSATVIMPGGCAVTVDSIPMINCSTHTVDISNAQSHIALYPNPNDGSFTVDATTMNTTGKVSIQMFNLVGQVVYQQLVDNTNGKIHKAINANAIPGGIYIVKVQIGSESYVQRVVISH